MKKTIDNKIKDFYKTKVNFAKETGVKPADLTRKLKSLHTKITWVNEIIKLLNFKLQLSNIDSEIKSIDSVIVSRIKVNGKIVIVTSDTYFKILYIKFEPERDGENCIIFFILFVFW